jgi:hypothetical protein
VRRATPRSRAGRLDARCWHGSLSKCGAQAAKPRLAAHAANRPALLPGLPAAHAFVSKAPATAAARIRLRLAAASAARSSVVATSAASSAADAAKPDGAAFPLRHASALAQRHDQHSADERLSATFSRLTARAAATRRHPSGPAPATLLLSHSRRRHAPTSRGAQHHLRARQLRLSRHAHRILLLIPVCRTPTDGR